MSVQFSGDTLFVPTNNSAFQNVQRKLKGGDRSFKSYQVTSGDQTVGSMLLTSENPVATVNVIESADETLTEKVFEKKEELETLNRKKKNLEKKERWELNHSMDN